MSAVEQKWDAIYQQHSKELAVTEVLRINSFLLPPGGQALDLACGLGGNALFLAERGLQVEAWDISPVALALLQQQAAARRLVLSTKTVDVRSAVFPRNAFDVVVVSRFLDRTICHAIMNSMKSGGLLFYQTFTAEKSSAQGPSNPDYLLQRNELLTLFSPLQLVYYRENSRLGSLDTGDRNEAGLVGQK